MPRFMYSRTSSNQKIVVKHILVVNRLNNFIPERNVPKDFQNLEPVEFFNTPSFLSVARHKKRSSSSAKSR